MSDIGDNFNGYSLKLQSYSHCYQIGKTTSSNDLRISHSLYFFRYSGKKFAFFKTRFCQFTKHDFMRLFLHVFQPGRELFSRIRQIYHLAGMLQSSLVKKSRPGNPLSQRLRKARLPMFLMIQNGDVFEASKLQMDDNISTQRDYAERIS